MEKTPTELHYLSTEKFLRSTGGPVFKDSMPSTMITVTSGRKAGQKKLREYFRSCGKHHQREPSAFCQKPTWVFLNIAVSDRMVMCDAQSKCGLCVIRNTQESSSPPSPRYFLAILIHHAAEITHWDSLAFSKPRRYLISMQAKLPIAPNINALILILWKKMKWGQDHPARTQKLQHFL